jgi:hypothetical protein
MVCGYAIVFSDLEKLFSPQGERELLHVPVVFCWCTPLTSASILIIDYFGIDNGGMFNVLQMLVLPNFIDGEVYPRQDGCLVRRRIYWLQLIPIQHGINEVVYIEMKEMLSHPS